MNGQGEAVPVPDDSPAAVFEDAGPVYREPTVAERAGQVIPFEGVLVAGQRKVRPLVKAGGEVAADAPVLVVRVASTPA